MLRATAFPAPYNSVQFLTRTRTCHFLAPTRAVHSHSPFVSRFVFRQFRQPRANLRAARGGGVIAAASKKKWRGGVGTDDAFDKYDDDVGDVGDGYDDVDEEGENGDGEGLLQFEKMEKWFKKKPKGFGEGKVYDTSIEDKLLVEIQQSRIAHAADIKKLKSNPVTHVPNKIDKTKKEAEVVPVAVVPVGARVRLVNLPKKKNIHRDLKLAFHGIPGIINIVPAVIGNKKTRDPICKGFAFVDFKYEEDAVRFVELYTGQTITFGKIQKQIKCELLDAQSSSSLKLSENLGARLQLIDSAIEEGSNKDSDIDDSALDSWDGTNSDDLGDLDNQVYGEEEGDDGDIQDFSADLKMDFYGEEEEDNEENQDSVTDLTLDFDDSVETTIDPLIDSFPSEQVDRNPTAEQKSSTNVKQENGRKKKATSKEKVRRVLDVPGSAKRLKVREKAVLSDVFSKYGLKPTLASKDSK